MKQIYNVICISIVALIKALGILAVAAETEAAEGFPEASQRLEEELAKAQKSKKLP